MMDELSFLPKDALLNSVCPFFNIFFFKQKTAYEMRISDWSSDVCSSDLVHRHSVTVRQHLKLVRADRTHPLFNRHQRRPRHSDDLRRFFLPNACRFACEPQPSDRKSTRLNSSH